MINLLHACKTQEEAYAVLTNTAARYFPEYSDSLNIYMEHDRKIVEPVTLSIGLALFPDHGETQEALIKSAAQALSDAKHAGRHRVVCAQAGSRGSGEQTESINEAVVMKQVADRNLIN